MASWGQFAAAEPELAERVGQLFRARKHMTLATLRRDGSPRISGTEVALDDDDLGLGMMPNSVKARDLLGDPRVALHSPTVDTPADDPSSWAGDAKIAGRALLVSGTDPSDTSHRFRIDISEVVLTRVGSPADHLVIESWTPDRGRQVRRR